MRRITTVGAIFVALVLAACGSESDDVVDGARAAGAAIRLVANTGGDLPYDEPVKISIDRGAIDSVTVTPDAGKPLEGSVNDVGVWKSNGLPEPGMSYKVAITAADRYGGTHNLKSSFGVAGVPDGSRLTLAMQPGAGDVVGVGAPVVIRFDQEVTDKAAVEENMHVASSPQVIGSWHWVSSQEVHFRPKDYWPTGASVAVDLDFNGVQVGDGLWGGRPYHLDFKVGQSRIAKVDARTKLLSMIVDGKTEYTWDTSLGKPEFATRNGTYVVLDKERRKRMTSCSVDITCNKNDDEFYDLEVDWSVRLTWSGTFVHAAPWSEGSQGQANVSHGCLNLSEANGEAYFKMSRFGDVVEVINSSRGPDDLVNRGDPGMVDWNQDWDGYVAGSALGSEFTTDKL